MEIVNVGQAGNQIGASLHDLVGPLSPSFQLGGVASVASDRVPPSGWLFVDSEPKVR
jgi:hypothetical protein